MKQERQVLLNNSQSQRLWLEEQVGLGYISLVLTPVLECLVLRCDEKGHIQSL